MVKVFLASFHRASEGKIASLRKALKERNMLSSADDADYIIAVGDREETFDFVLEQWRNNKKIIHLWAGEISQGTHDEVYRHTMTLMSDIQLCTSDLARERVYQLCSSVRKEANTYTVGNICLDNMEIDESLVPDYEYNVVLYNPPTRLDDKQIMKEVYELFIKLEDIPNYWIESNGDKGSIIVDRFANTKTLPRNKFLGLIKNCNKFYTNSSCADSEAQYVMDKENIVHIGIRNRYRESKYADQSITGATNSIIKILEDLDE